MSIAILKYWMSMDATNGKCFLITHQFLSWLHVTLLGPRFQFGRCLFSGKLSVANSSKKNPTVSNPVNPFTYKYTH